MDKTALFFNSLAQRFGKENDLSDITWALCQASPSFKEKWVHFFFPDLDLSSVDSIEREIPDDNGEGSRVDFLINIENQKPYLIEVKLKGVGMQTVNEVTKVLHGAGLDFGMII